MQEPIAVVAGVEQERHASLSQSSGNVKHFPRAYTNVEYTAGKIIVLGLPQRLGYRHREEDLCPSIGERQLQLKSD
ncbi:MAG TPA: hypothetical protein VEK84_13400 [Terriglobales bacterium]|nr:hypothetical protein [Terriglobales bacterium]